jgi:hypothetical protein
MTLIVTCIDQHPRQEFYFVLPTTSPLTSSFLGSGWKSMLLVKVKRTNTKRHKGKKKKRRRKQMKEPNKKGEEL